MTDDQRDDAPEEVVATDPPEGPVRAETPAGGEAPNERRKGRKGPPKGKRGLRLPRRFKKATPGSAAGIEPHDLHPVPGQPVSARITCIDYSVEQAVLEEVKDLPAFIAEHRPEWATVRWINVDGIGDLGVDPGPRREVPPPPAGHRGRAPRDAAARRSRPTRRKARFQARLFIIVKVLELREHLLPASRSASSSATRRC